MYRVDIEREFSAAHNLRGYQGNCSELHGHNWAVQAIIKANDLDSIGIAVDFRKLKSELDKILNDFDHKNLSELDCFKKLNPTSEVIAKVVFDRLSEALNDERVEVEKIRICESPGSGATYSKD